MAALVREAYVQLGLANGGEARGAVARLRQLAGGEAPTPGLGDLEGRLVAARGGMAALQIGPEPTATVTGSDEGIVSFEVGPRGAGEGALFFRADTGEPVAFEPDVLLAFLAAHERDRPSVPLFLAYVAPADFESGWGHALYDPAKRAWVAKARRILVHPGGKLAYAFQTADCRWHEWSLSEQRETRALEKLPGDECDDAENAGALIPAAGKWLIAGGLWDLRTGMLRRTAKREPVLPGDSWVVSPDGRHLAMLRVRKPGRAEDAFAGRAVDLALFDLKNETETAASEPAFASLANGRPLDFVDGPLRLRVTDYSQWLFSIPALRVLARSGARGQRPDEPSAFRQPGSTRPAAAPPDTTGLRDRLDAQVCRLAGFVLPRALCGAQPTVLERSPP